MDYDMDDMETDGEILVLQEIRSPPIDNVGASKSAASTSSSSSRKATSMILSSSESKDTSTSSFAAVKMFPHGEFRNSSMNELIELKTDMMCNWLYQQQLEKMWCSNGADEGVMLKKARDDYKCCPKDLQSLPDGLFQAVQKLNVKVRNEEIV